MIPDDNHLRTYRIILLVGIISHPLIGLLRHMGDTVVHDPMALMLATTAAGIGVLALSYVTRAVRNNFINLVYLLGFIVSIHILYVLAANNFSPDYVKGFFLILTGVSIIFNTGRPLVF